MVSKDSVTDFVATHPTDVLVILGAGDLDNYTQRIADIVSKN